jgi:hypothetical protein
MLQPAQPGAQQGVKLIGENSGEKREMACLVALVLDQFLDGGARRQRSTWGLVRLWQQAEGSSLARPRRGR